MPRNLLLLFLTTLSFGCTTDNPDQQLDVDLAANSDVDQGTDVDMGMSTGTDMATVDGGDVIALECRNLAAAVCARLGKCSPFRVRYYYGDEKTCLERVQLTCAPYIHLNGSSWTAARLRACTAGYVAATCEEYDQAGGPAACQPQPGTLADGSACANSNQCKSAYCTALQNACGKCVTVGKAGDACSATKPCGLGISCTNNKCVTDGGAGAACGNGVAACKPDFYCKTGQCTAVLAEGATCDPNASGCDTLAGNFCNTTTRKCEAYKLADAGGACGTVMGSTVLCAAGGTCPNGTATRHCVAAAKDGDMCSPLTGDASCMDPAACNQGTCQIFDPSTCK